MARSRSSPQALLDQDRRSGGCDREGDRKIREASEHHQMIAALFVEPGGPYFAMPDVDPWGVDRDARTYAGPGPIVAHPPCGPWGALKHLYRGNEHDCAPI